MSWTDATREVGEVKMGASACDKTSFAVYAFAVLGLACASTRFLLFTVRGCGEKDPSCEMIALVRTTAEAAKRFGSEA